MNNCHLERSVAESKDLKILRLFAIANFASQTTQDDRTKQRIIIVYNIAYQGGGALISNNVILQKIPKFYFLHKFI